MNIARVISGMVLGSSLCIAAFVSTEAQAGPADRHNQHARITHHDGHDRHHRHDRHEEHNRQRHLRHKWLHKNGIPHDYDFGYSRHDGHPHKSWRKAHRYWSQHYYNDNHRYSRHHREGNRHPWQSYSRW